MEFSEFKMISVFCLANPNKKVSFEDDRAIEEIKILVPYNYMAFLEIESIQAKFQEFSELG